jgi:hypothetical protein
MAKGEKTGGRVAGTPNKMTKTLKQDILDAAELAHPDGRVGYLVWASKEQPTAFMSLLGKVLPTEIQPLGSDGNPTDKFVVEIVKV